MSVLQMVVKRLLKTGTARSTGSGRRCQAWNETRGAHVLFINRRLLFALRLGVVGNCVVHKRNGTDTLDSEVMYGDAD